MTMEHLGDSGDRFEWHPTYRGRSVAEVRAEIARRLASDQRALALALEGAEQHENDVLTSVLEMERRWGEFDFGWVEAEAGELADRIVAFEQERERRKELFPYSVHRDEQESSAAEAGDRPRWAFWKG